MAAPPPPVPVPAHLRDLRVFGLGILTYDLIGTVPSYPAPDTKLRTTSLRSGGGGNAPNALTALRRLGVPVTLASQVGSDVSGDTILRELEADDIDTSHVLRRDDDVPTATMFIAVASDANTRTVFGTVPREELPPERMTPDLLAGVDVLLLDTRHTLAAIELARHARRAGVPVVLDVERFRPHIEELLPLADVIITNSEFPQLFAPNAPDRLHAQRALLHAAESAHTVVSTVGAEGSVLVRALTDANVAELESPGQLLLEIRTTVAPPVTEKQCGLEGAHDIGQGGPAGDGIVATAQVLQCPPWGIEEVIDTTGAGDAFIGAFVYGVATKMSASRAMCLGAYVAAKNVGVEGARAGSPRREDVPEELL